MKPSKAQYDVLKRMSEGAKLTNFHGWSGRWCRLDNDKVNESTVTALEKAGYVQHEDAGWNSDYHYELTDAGRKALEAEPPREPKRTIVTLYCVRRNWRTSSVEVASVQAEEKDKTYTLLDKAFDGLPDRIAKDSRDVHFSALEAAQANADFWRQRLEAARRDLESAEERAAKAAALLVQVQAQESKRQLSQPAAPGQPEQQPGEGGEG